MSEGWLADGDSGSDWLEVIDWEGDVLGYSRRRDAVRMDLPVITIETPQRYLEDPYVRVHAVMAKERGVLSQGNDLNDVQLVLIQSNVLKQREIDEKLRERSFEENMYASNPTLWKSYMDNKNKTAEIEAGMAVIEERVPRSIDEFLADLAAFSEEEVPTGIKERERVEGWLAALLTDDDLEDMQDE